MNHPIPHFRRLRTPEAANYLKLSASYLAKMRVHGGGPRYGKFGKVVVYDTDDLDAWAEACSRANTTEPGRA
jgi:hypothetical protein